MNLSLVASFLGTHTSTAARVAAVKAALNTPAGPILRQELGNSVIRMLPAETIVPEIYAAWRPLVRDSMLFMITRLSAARLAPKLVEQVELPPDTTPEKRLLHLIAKVPGLQKIGQVLARNRHFDPALRNALTELENGIRDVTADEITALVRKELGKRMAAYEVGLEGAILAEASVSAVMRFEWRNPDSGERERGVFKVRKPYVAAFFAEDLELLDRLAQFLAGKHPDYGRALPDTILEVRRLLEREVDFAREQSTLIEAAKVYRGVRGVRVPRLIPALSTSVITAMSEEQGRKVTALADGPAARRRRAASRLIEALVAAPLFAHGERSIYHADPHAGNLLYDEHTGELVLLDWALTEGLTREQRRHTALLAIMLGLRDPVGVCAEIEALAVGRHLSAAHREFTCEYVDDSIRRLPFTRLPNAMDAMRLLDRLALEGVRFPPGLMMFRKVLFTLDGILHDIAIDKPGMELILARYLVTQSPLSLIDWLGVEASALFYGARLWVQCAQNILSRADGWRFVTGPKRTTVRRVPPGLVLNSDRCVLIGERGRAMVRIENPVELAEDLCKLGLDASHEIVFGPRGYQEGLDVGSDFFPLWELTLPENRDSLARLDFAAIKARRATDWSVAPPGYLTH